MGSVGKIVSCEVAHEDDRTLLALLIFDVSPTVE